MEEVVVKEVVSENEGKEKDNVVKEEPIRYVSAIELRGKVIESIMG